jgi:hypothetical protein
VGNGTNNIGADFNNVMAASRFSVVT